MLVSQLTPMISQLHETISQHSAYHESMLNTLRDKVNKQYTNMYIYNYNDFIDNQF